MRATAEVVFVLALAAVAYRHFIKSRPKVEFVPYSLSSLGSDTLVVDSSHSSARQVTHHLKGQKQKELMDLSLRGDTSTDGVLNGLKRKHPDTCAISKVTANHFDIDSFLPVFSCINPKTALEFERIIREVAIIGDFRELRLDDDYQYHALKLACYLNSEERRLFYKPFAAAISTENGEVEAITKFRVSDNLNTSTFD